MSSDKIGPQHRARKAVLYVRQSSTHQVQHNRESQLLQYAMRDRLVLLGWSEIEVVDDDLGCSAAGGTTRAGFERMVAEVCLGKVGAVAAREVSRFPPPPAMPLHLSFAERSLWQAPPTNIPTCWRGSPITRDGRSTSRPPPVPG